MEKVGRNDLCPCGSGKKFKKCCGKSQVISIEKLIEKETQELQMDIIQFALDHYEEEMDEFLVEQLEPFDLPEEAYELIHFHTLIYFITSIEVDGNTILSHYINRNLAKISRPKIRGILQSWMHAKPSITVIEDQNDQQLLTLRDFFTDEIHQVKVDEEDLPVETGGMIIGTILPAGATSVFFATFLELPANETIRMKELLLIEVEKSNEEDPLQYVHSSFPEILHLFVIGPEPSIEDLEWLSPKHKQVALEFEETLEDENIIRVGIQLWHQYCQKKNPKIVKTRLYSVALLYLVHQYYPLGGYVTQKELAEDFQISPSGLADKYRDMKKVLREELDELRYKLIFTGFNDLLSSTYHDHEDFFDEEDFWDEEDERIYGNLDPNKDEIETNTPYATASIKAEREQLALTHKMENQPFHSSEDTKHFLNNLPQGQPGELTHKEKAQELLFDAYESTGNKRKQFAEKALKLYPNSPDAYNILAEFEMNPLKEEKLFLKAMKAGEQELGHDFFKENIGHFWGLVSTRPYMRAKRNYAILLQETDRVDEAIQQYEELLELNPVDNQAVRYDLFTAYIEKDLLQKAENLLHSFPEDFTAHGTYNSVLLEFLQNGATPKAKQLLHIAKQQNPYVPDYLLRFKGIPIFLPNSYQLGEESEAIIYADQHFNLWDKNHTLIDWLEKNV